MWHKIQCGMKRKRKGSDVVGKGLNETQRGKGEREESSILGVRRREIC